MYTVLLIEDQNEIATVLRLVLSRKGYRALLALNLAEATKIWSAYKDEIHLVLTDNYLPDGSGIRFAEELLRERPSLKVIVASGNPLTDIPSQFQRVDKPFDISTLTEAVERALPKTGADSIPP